MRPDGTGHFSADAPRGQFTTHLAQLRVISLDEDEDHEQVLGAAPVETDGSFYITVPADHPIRFELLGARGNVIHAQRSWIWVRPGEDRGCLGCHENKVRAITAGISCGAGGPGSAGRSAGRKSRPL